MPILVNDELVEDVLIREEMRAVRPRHETEIPNMDPLEREGQIRDWARENVVERVLLRQAAWRDATPIPPEALEQAVQAAKSQSTGQPACHTEADEERLRYTVESQLRVERLVDQVTQPIKPPKLREVSEYYVKHRDQFWLPESAGVAHIVKNVDEQQDEATARAGIEEAQQALAAGEEFASVANRLSDCAGNGGDLGIYPRGNMVDEFEEVVFSLPVGAVSDIFRTPFGFHIARVYHRQPAGIASLEQVRDRVADLLWQRKRVLALEQHLDKLRAAATVRDAQRSTLLPAVK